MKTPTSIHDGLFKSFLTVPETAKDFLDVHLPGHIKQICNLDTLQLQSGSFLEEELVPYYSDVLYSMETESGVGYVYALIEHQSSPDKHMGFRLMRYAIAAMKQHLDAGNKTLPLVVPLLELVQKHVRQRDLLDFTDTLVTLLLERLITSKQLDSLVEYLLRVGETSNLEDLMRTLARQVPEHEERFMTVAEQLEARGREQGLKQGLQQGRQEGSQETQVAIAKKMLLAGSELTFISEVTGLSESEITKLIN
ncbi:Rpn family recombination-promoting nuclease/putative transposase [Vibrio parahaemolyticus]